MPIQPDTDIRCCVIATHFLVTIAGLVILGEGSYLFNQGSRESNELKVEQGTKLMFCGAAAIAFECANQIYTRCLSRGN